MTTQPRQNRRYGTALLAGCSLLLGLSLGLGGCIDRLAWMTRPRPVADAEGRRWLLLRETTPNIDDPPQYRLLRADPSDHFAWRHVGRYAGDAIALAFRPAPPGAEDAPEVDAPARQPDTARDSLWTVMADGTVLWMPAAPDGQAARRLPGRNAFHFAAAAYDASADRLLALADNDDRDRGGAFLQLYALSPRPPLQQASAPSREDRTRPARRTAGVPHPPADNTGDAPKAPASAGVPADGWQPLGAPLPLAAAAAAAWVICDDRGGVWAFWRGGSDASTAAQGIGAARFDGAGWSLLPTLATAGGQAAPFAPLALRGKPALILDRLPRSADDDAGGDSATPGDLSIWTLDEEARAWHRTAELRLPISRENRKPLGLAAAVLPGAGAGTDKAEWWLARTDTRGASAFVAMPAPDGGWSLEAAGTSADIFQASGEPGLLLPQPMSRFTLAVAGLWMLLMAVLLGASWGFFRWMERWTPSRKRPGALATPLDRGMAFIVDGVLMAPFPLLYYAFAYNDFHDAPNPTPTLYWLWLGALSVYAAIAEGYWGMTVGKRLMNLRVRSALGGRGGRIAWWQAWSRNLLRAADFWPWTLGSGFFLPYLTALAWVLLTPGRQRMGDWAAQTMVRRHIPPERRKWVLASASPRRAQLLREYGLQPAIAPVEVHEAGILASTPQETAIRRAEHKLRAAEKRLRDDPAAGDEIVIAGDTIVSVDGRILDKPGDPSETAFALRRLSGRTHTVCTGLAILDRATGQFMAAVEVTEVDFRDLSPEGIQAYADSGEGLDKAGGYGIQGSGGALVASWRGSYSNVVGMPMELFDRMVSELDG